MSVTQSCDLYWPLVPCEAQSSESWTVRKYSVSAFLVRGSVVGEVFSPVRMSSVWDYFPLCCWLTGCPLTQHGHVLTHKQSGGSAHKHGAARSTHTWRVAFIWFASPWWRRSFSTWLEWARVNIAFKRTPLSSPRHLLPALIPARVSAQRAGSDGILCADSHVGVDGQDVSAPRVPSEGGGGGQYTDVFLQMAFWTNIPSSAWPTVHQWSHSLSARRKGQLLKSADPAGRKEEFLPFWISAFIRLSLMSMSNDSWGRMTSSFLVNLNIWMKMCFCVRTATNWMKKEANGLTRRH